MNLDILYADRFSPAQQLERLRLWEVLWRSMFSRLIRASDTVYDIGAGSGEFLRTITASRKIAIDPIAPKELSNHGITVIRKSVFNTPDTLLGQADVIMISNFLEHLNSKAEVMDALKIARSMLKPRGIVIIIQPVIDLAGSRYWDFIDHQVPLTRASLLEAVANTGLATQRFIPRFLPYTTKIWIPKSPLFLAAYLLIPWILRPFAGQCLLVARNSGR